MNVRKRAQLRQAIRLGFAAAARCAFHARGERAWQRYLRTRKARPLDEVFDELDARLSAKRREVQWSFGAELAKGATAVQFPPAPEPQDWDWEPPRLELTVKPANLDDNDTSPDANLDATAGRTTSTKLEDL